MLLINRGKSSVSFEQRSSKKKVFLRNGTNAIRIRSVARVDYETTPSSCCLSQSFSRVSYTSMICFQMAIFVF